MSSLPSDSTKKPSLSGILYVSTTPYRAVTQRNSLYKQSSFVKWRAIGQCETIGQYQSFNE
eukprot:scaffold2185_cov257-Chaetoceros_neogracile.AAC.1